jgi:glutathione S-transferase
MNALSLQNPLFATPLFTTYVIVATLMILKAANARPRPGQLDPDERVERLRRIQANDTENLPYFLAAGFLYILTGPPLWLAQVLLYGYVLTRLAHFAAYLTAQIHDVRALLWTPGSLILIFMAGRTLLAALGH